MSFPIIHLRAETKPLERRSPLSPSTAETLIKAGYKILVEKSADRIYDDEEFVAAGATLVEPGSWVNADKDTTIILGLKELPDDGTPLYHTFIHFQHCFKKQDGWEAALARFQEGSLLYDLEFLAKNGRRVAAFGYWAGYAGPVPVFNSAPELVTYVKDAIQGAIAANKNEKPRIIVIGAKGRCGSGAVKFASDAGLEDILQWDMDETAKGGPFPEIAESDIFVNCVYLTQKLPPFTTFEALSGPERRLRVICDVSCDPDSENNPIPVYSTYSSFNNPTVPIAREIPGPEVRVVAIDHLPTLIARESSDEFAGALLESLLALNKRDTEPVWKDAQKIFEDRVKEMKALQ
ncbi:hypothetical protein N7470_003605 [Penicillium chermesinum]|nr:hypothetical protein N7470_003605 [Penicillium chermesinum]